MPRCTRCNAPLNNAPPGEDATARDPHDDATARDPLGGAPRPGEPLPPPWTPAPQEPAQWGPGSPFDQPPPGPPPGHTVPAPPSGETSTPLSPEPWAQSMSPEPWAEPAIWQPPAPPKKSRTPYFLAAAGTVLLLGVALGIVFWPSGSDSAAQPSGDSPSVQAVSPAPDDSAGATGEGPGDGDAEEQAGAVDDLLDDMGGTRRELGGVVVAGCPAAGLQRVLDSRRDQLERARALDVSALDGGPPMKDALVRALEASTESNQRYLDVAPGCPSESEVADVNQRASSAKSEFLGYWSSVAAENGLPARSESDI
ncbi:hypothetical protein ACN3XK_08300 [Actinomadura welshii]